MSFIVIISIRYNCNNQYYEEVFNTPALYFLVIRNEISLRTKARKMKFSLTL